MKKYIKPETCVNVIQPEGLLATSFEVNDENEINGPMGAPPRNSKDDFWSFDYS